jgi:multiple sugar transport system substrate-binding protein
MMHRRTTNFDRPLLYLGLAVLIIAGFLLLPPSAPSPDPETPPPQEDRSLVFVHWWQDGPVETTLARLVREFEEARPDIRIRLEKGSPGEVQNRLQNPAPETPPPDISALDPRWMGELIRADLLEPLNRLPRGLPVEFEGRAAAIISSMDLLFYNVPLLQAAGFDRPPKDQAEFLAFARTLSDPAGNRYGAALALGTEDPGVYRNIFPWLRASGLPLVQDGVPQFNSPGIRGALEFLHALNAEKALSPGSFAKTEEAKLREFITGRAAMILGPVSDIPRIREQGPVFGVTAIPAPARYIGKPAFGLSSWYAGIPRAGRHREEALAFFSFLANRAAQPGAPARTILAALDRPPGGDPAGEDPLYTKALDIYESGDRPQDLYGIPRNPELETILREELYRMFEQNQTPAETAETLQKRWEEALTRETPNF